MINKIINYIILGATMQPAMPHRYVNYTLKSDISNILTELSSLLPQYSTFIGQFNDLVSQASINVITDSAGNMSIDVPSNMSNTEAENISKRIGIIDRVIATRSQEIHDLIQRGVNMENDLRNKNPNYTSQLTDKITEYNRLKNLYKHQ